MIVARQFIAWNNVRLRIRPVGNGLIPTHDRLTVLIVARLSDAIIPFPTGRFPILRWNQAINCLATIIQSLRDKVRPYLRDYNPLRFSRDLTQC